MMNKTWKKVFAIVAVIAVTATSSVGVFAEYDPDKVVNPNEVATKSTKPVYAVTVNGTYLADAQVYVSEDDHVMLPIRAIAETLGFEVGWDAGRVTLTKSPIYVTFAVGEDSYTFARTAPMQIGKAAELNTADEKTYVPEVFFSDILQADIQIEQNGEITISYGEEAAATTGRATITSVTEDTEHDYYAVLIQDEEQGEVQLNVSDETEIVLADGTAGTPADLTADMAIEVVYSPAMTASIPPQNAPEKITVLGDEEVAEPEAVEGQAVITNVTDDQVTVEDEKLGEVVLNIGEDTVITLLDGTEGEISDLAADMDVDVVYSAAMTASLPPQNVPVSITVVEREAQAPEATEGKAVITAVEDERITVEDEALGEVVLNIGEDTVITLLDGTAGEVADLAVDMDVDVVYSPVMTKSLPPQNVPVSITVVEREDVTLENATVQGEIKEISEADSNGNIKCLIEAVVTDENPNEEIALIISEDTVITNADGSEASVEDLEAGMTIEAEHSPAMTMSIPPQTAAVSIQIME